MSLGAACGWTLLRSLCVALLTVPLCWWLHNELARLPRGRRVLLWTLLLIPFLTPTLLTGYAYSNFSLSLVRHPNWNEVLYMTLLAVRLLPIGTLVIYFAPPPPLSAEAVHCARLARAQTASLQQRIAAVAPFAIRGPLRALLTAFAVLFLFVFQEFELASLMGTVSWTVWLFDAQAGGMFLSESLRLAILPMLIQLAILVPLIVFAMRSRSLPPTHLDRQRAAGTWQRAPLWVLAVAACGAVLLTPFLLVGRDTVAGLGAVLRNPSMLTEIGTAIGFGVASGLCGSLLAAWILKPATNQRTQLSTLIALLVALPGFSGSLIVSLGILGLFQLQPLQSLYDTPLPALLALVLFLVPRAILIQLLLQAARPRQGVWLAQLLKVAPDPHQQSAGHSIHWKLSLRGQLLAACVICLWGYLELTPVAILAPPGMTSAPVRLYNLMHYGRSHVLSALTLVSIVAPVILAGLGLAGARFVTALYWKSKT